MSKNKDAAIVLFSGGQDSTTCLYWAKYAFKEVIALNMFYGQRHKLEIYAAETIASMAEILLIKKDLGSLFTEIGDSALIGKGKFSKTHRASENLPASFVPGRNLILLTIAAMIAFKRGIHHIVIGVCETDYSGYPDCRSSAIDAVECSVSYGMDFKFKIHTPLMEKTKADTVKFAIKLPGCVEALAYSHTCYEGVFPPCRECPACNLRAKGFIEAGVIDPLELRGINAR